MWGAGVPESPVSITFLALETSPLSLPAPRPAGSAAPSPAGCPECGPARGRRCSGSGRRGRAPPPPAPQAGLPGGSRKHRAHADKPARGPRGRRAPLQEMPPGTRARPSGGLTRPGSRGAASAAKRPPRDPPTPGRKRHSTTSREWRRGWTGQQKGSQSPFRSGGGGGGRSPRAPPDCDAARPGWGAPAPSGARGPWALREPGRARTHSRS